MGNWIYSINSQWSNQQLKCSHSSILPWSWNPNKWSEWEAFARRETFSFPTVPPPASPLPPCFTHSSTSYSTKLSSTWLRHRYVIPLLGVPPPLSWLSSSSYSSPLLSPPPQPTVFCFFVRNLGQWYKMHRAPIACICIHVSSARSTGLSSSASCLFALHLRSAC